MKMKVVRSFYHKKMAKVLTEICKAPLAILCALLRQEARQVAQK